MTGRFERRPSDEEYDIMSYQLFEVTPRSPATANSRNSPSKNPRGVVGRIASHVPPSAMNLLVLSYRTFPGAWFRKWRRRAATFPREVGFVRIGETVRSAPTDESITGTREPPSLVEAVPDPADVTGLKGTIRVHLDDWADNSHRTVIYLDSLAGLVRAVGLDTAYSLLHTLSGRIRSANGFGYYRMRSSTENNELADLLGELTDNHLDLTDSVVPRRSARE